MLLLHLSPRAWTKVVRRGGNLIIGTVMAITMLTIMATDMVMAMATMLGGHRRISENLTGITTATATI